MGVRILQLVGSRANEPMYDLSLLYARGCAAALAGQGRFTFVDAVVKPDGSWRFPLALDRDSIDRAEPLTLPAALARIDSEHIDIGLPQMFCSSGMTHYRSIFELLGIPYLGNRPEQMALTADKAKARAIVAAAGVDVPAGELLRRGEVPALEPPVVVKPATSDNSDGVSHVTSTSQYASALAEAFRYSDTVLVERYVELGREIRCGIVARDGTLVCLPLEEYYVHAIDRPVRTRADKLKRTAENGLTLVAKEQTQSWIVAPGDPIVAAAWAAAERCYRALGCEQYGLFDFRIDPNGRPWFLEAGLYCSFSPQSVIVTMAEAAGMPLVDFFSRAIGEAVRDSARSCVAQ